MTFGSFLVVANLFITSHAFTFNKAGIAVMNTDQTTNGRGEAETTATTTTTAGKYWQQFGPERSRCNFNNDYQGKTHQECQAYALDAGHSYYQFRADTKQCSTMATCDSPETGTSNIWKIYHLKEAPTDTPGWTNGHGKNCDAYWNKRWCANRGLVSGNEWTGKEGICEVQNPGIMKQRCEARCQPENDCGVRFNHPRSNCVVCGKGIPAGTQIWHQFEGDMSRCNMINDYTGKTHEECQEIAVFAGHSFYQFRADKGTCTSMATCDSPITGTFYDWKIYYLTEA